MTKVTREIKDASGKVIQTQEEELGVTEHVAVEKTSASTPTETPGAAPTATATATATAPPAAAEANTEKPTAKKATAAK